MADPQKIPFLRSRDTKQLEKIQVFQENLKERDFQKTAKKRGIPYIDLRKTPISQDALRLLSLDDVRLRKTVAFRLFGKTVSLAAVEPENPLVSEVVKRFEKQGFLVQLFLCSPESIAFFEQTLTALAPQKFITIATTVDEPDFLLNKSVFASDYKIFQQGTGADMLNRINLGAVAFRASDVHFQPEHDQVLVRMRRDGDLYQVLALPMIRYLMMLSEVKRISGIKMNISKLPQDGSYHFEANQRLINVRVSTLPSEHGESLELRVLDTKQSKRSFAELGFSNSHDALLRKKLKERKGMILVTGPTGSGKTSTLYSCLQFLNNEDLKIMTLEDPIEYELPNTVQSQIKEEEGYTFSKGLRALVRQDPDIIMIGEIRDKESAEIALQASLTGHLILSTVHAPRALETIPRLLNMGVEPYMLSSGLQLIIAQRLVRTLCERCKTPAILSASEQKELENVLDGLKKKGISIPALEGHRAGKCNVCMQTGFLGRTVVAEMLVLDDFCREAITDDFQTRHFVELLEKNGFFTMFEDATLKFLQGKISWDEVKKVQLSSDIS